MSVERTRRSGGAPVRVLVWVGVLWLVWVSGASASSRIALPYVPAGGPVLVTGGAAWAQTTPDFGFALTESIGGTLSTVQTISPTPKFLLDPRLASSGDRLAVEVRARYLPTDPHDQANATVQTYAGLLGSPLTPLTPECAGIDQTSTQLRSTGVDQQAVAYLGPECAGRAVSHASITDFSTMPSTTMTLGPRYAFGLRVAGRYAAWLTGGPNGGTAIEVFDRVSRQRAYGLSETVIAGVPGPYLGDIPSFDLQNDGKVAFVVSASDRHGARVRVAWASPQQPYPHRLALPARPHYALRLVNDQLAVLAANDYSTGLLSHGTLELVDLQGHVRHVVARGVDDVLLNEHFDFDGTRLTFVTQRCGQAVVHIVDATASTITNRLPRTCPAKLVAPPGLEAKAGRLVLRFSCRGLAGYCTVGEVSVTLDQALPGDRRGVLIAHGFGQFYAATASLNMTRRGRALARAHHHLKLKIRATLGSPSFVVGSDLTGVQTQTIDINT